MVDKPLDGEKEAARKRDCAGRCAYKAYAVGKSKEIRLEASSLRGPGN